MSQHQPGWANQPQQPPQPQWGAQTQPMWGAPPPQPPKKRRAGKIAGLGCLGIVGLFIIIAIAAAATSSGSKNDSSSSGSTASASHGGSKGAAPAKAGGSDTGGGAHTVTFKVWGTAPAGDLGGLDISYGSDTDTRKGDFKNGSFSGSVPFKKDAMYFQVNAQLQGSGDIQCSVTVDGHTKSGHAQGGYNICSAQLSSTLFGNWG